MGAPLDDYFAGRVRERLLELVAEHPDVATICPQLAARAVAAEMQVEWQDLMRPVRMVAADLVRRGTLEAVQHGRAVDISQARGPIGLRRKRYSGFACADANGQPL